MYSEIYATENQNSYPEMGLRLLGFSGFAPEPGAAHSPIPHCVCWLGMGLRIPRNWLSFYDGLVHGIELRERWRLGLRRAAGSRVSVLKAPSRGCVENSCLHVAGSVSVWGLVPSFVNFSVPYLLNGFANDHSL